MESPSSPWANGEEGKISERPQQIVFDDTPSPSSILQGTPALPSQQAFEMSQIEESDSSLKSFFMFTLGLLLPFFIVFLIFSLGIALDDETYEREMQELQELQEEYPNPYDLSLLRNESGTYSATIDLPETHDLSQCTFDRYGGEQSLYTLLEESIVCSTSNPQYKYGYVPQNYASYLESSNAPGEYFNGYSNVASSELLVWQRIAHPPTLTTVNLLDAEYNFQSKNLSLSFEDNLSENLSLDIFILNEENQFSKFSVLGTTSDGKNYTFQNPVNSTDEFYMEMILYESNYFFSAEACDTCEEEQSPYLDQVQFAMISPHWSWVEIGNYDSQNHVISFDPLPLSSGSEFPEQLEFEIEIDWTPVSITNETAWVSQANGRFLTSPYKIYMNENGTYERTFPLSNQTSSPPVLDCAIDSSSWPSYYEPMLRYPIFCGDVESSSEYDSMIYQISPFEIDEYISIIDQEWDPVNREFFVEFNRTLNVQENDFYGSESYMPPFRERPDSIGVRNNFTVTFEESDGDRDWASFQMYFEIAGNTSIIQQGHFFTWYVCDDCVQNLSEPTYRGISSKTEVIGGFNLVNHTLWFHPSVPTPPMVEISLTLVPEEFSERTGQLNYGVFLYGEEYTEYNSNYRYYHASSPSEDLYYYSFLVSPFVYVGAIVYSFIRGNKAFGKGLISSSIAALALVGVFVVFLFMFLF